MNKDIRPLAAVGHMPFPGHRTMATVFAQRDAAKKRCHNKGIPFGFDPNSLEPQARKGKAA